MKPIQSAFIFSLVYLVMSALLQSVEARSNDVKKGEETYKANCEACHQAGKNVVKEGKDIVTSKNIASLTEFENFLREKHGLMPAFPHIANNKDLVQPLYKYVKTLKDQDWEYEPEASDKTPIEPAKKAPGEPAEPPVKHL